MFTNQFPVGPYVCAQCLAAVDAVQTSAYTMPRKPINVSDPDHRKFVVYVDMPESKYWSPDLKHTFCSVDCAHMFKEL